MSRILIKGTVLGPKFNACAGQWGLLTQGAGYSFECVPSVVLGGSRNPGGLRFVGEGGSRLRPRLSCSGDRLRRSSGLAIG